MKLGQAICEVIQENPIAIGLFFSLLGQLGDRIIGIFPACTIAGFGLGFLLYLWSSNKHTKRGPNNENI